MVNRARTFTAAFSSFHDASNSATAFRAIMNGPAGSPPCFGLSAILRPVTHSIFKPRRPPPEQPPLC